MGFAPARPSSTGVSNEETFNADELIDRLYRGEDAVLELVAAMPPLPRAHLAMFCYHRSHLHRIGLALAASCDEATLIQAFGTALGLILYAQSREYTREAGRGPKVTLAIAPRIPQLFAEIDGHAGAPRRAAPADAARARARCRPGRAAGNALSAVRRVRPLDG